MSAAKGKSGKSEPKKRKRGGSNKSTSSCDETVRFADRTEDMSDMEADMEAVESTEGNVNMRNMNEMMWQFFNDNSEDIIEKLITTHGWKEEMRFTEGIDATINELKDENADLRKRLAISEGRNTRLEKQVDLLSSKVTDLTVRSMRYNVVIKELAEDERESSEALHQKILHFFRQDLQLDEREMMIVEIERAHRVGEKRNGRTRNIVAKLNSKGKEIAMSNKKNLSKQCKIKITDQYPREVHAKRERLWPVFTRAKDEGKTAKWKQDKLRIDGKEIKATEDKINDINTDITARATKMSPKHSAVSTGDGSHFQAHSVRITSKEDVIPAIKALGADVRVAGASHVMYAYRTGTERYAIHNYEDDGEWGSGRMIMEAIEEKNIYNQLICVTRWHYGKHMGRARFDVIKNLAIEAIDKLS